MSRYRGLSIHNYLTEYPIGLKLCRTTPVCPRIIFGKIGQSLFFVKFDTTMSYMVKIARGGEGGRERATAALQLLSHLEGDALNVALLVPESRRATRVGLVGALTLTDYRHQFERKTRTAREDPSIFPELCRHLDSVSPEIPIRDIVDCCRVWESPADSDTQSFSKPGPDRTLPIYTVDASSCGMDDRVVAADTTTQPAPDQLETLLRRLLPGPVVPHPPLKPVPSILEQLLVFVLTEVQAPQPLSHCCRVCSPGLWPRRRGRSRVPCDGTGLWNSTPGPWGW